MSVRTTTVRPARTADLADLVRIVHAAFASYRDRLVPPSGAHGETENSLAERLAQGALVAEEDGEAVGCLFCRDDGGDLYVGRLAVLRECRGRGIGGVLMEAACDIARGRGLTGIVVGVRLQLPENIGFFASLGFRPFDVGTHEGFAHPTFLWMRHTLRGE